MGNVKMKKLRELLNGNKIVKVAGAHDGMSAKVAEMKGFDAIWASGLGISAVNRVPDASILTMTDYLNSTIVMNESCSIPVIADCDSGFGNIHNVIRMTKKYESYGIAGICIEDKLYPKMNSFVDTEHSLISTKDFCAKIKAVKTTQTNKDFILIARTEALIAKEGQEEAYKRAKAYASSGADAILIHSKINNPSEIIEFVEHWDMNIPIVVVPTMYPQLTYQQLEDMGIKVVIYANHALRASLTAISKTLENIMLNKTSLEIEREIASVSDVLSFLEVQHMSEIEDEIYQHMDKECI